MDAPPPPRRAGPRNEVSMVWDNARGLFICTITRWNGRQITPPIVRESKVMHCAAIGATGDVNEHFDAQGWDWP